MTHDLKTVLEDHVAAEYADAPVSTFDLGRAREDGRRRVLASRLAPIGGGVAVVAACALVVNGLGGTSQAGAGTAATSAAAGHGFTGTDPLTKGARFGWLPAGFQATAHSSGDYGNGVTAQTSQSYSNTSTTAPALVLTSSATEPYEPAGTTRKPVTVAGSQRAYLVTNPYVVPAALSVDWQTASGSWLRLSGTIAGDQEATLLKVADSAAADGTAVPLPIHIEGLPKGFTLETAELDDPAAIGVDGFNVVLAYHKPGDPSPSFSITASGGKSVTATNPHIVSAEPKGGTCEDSDGLHICVQDDQHGSDPLASIGGAKGLLDRITSLGTDPANWTTNVVS
ncbi:hypothetical protein KGQ20_01230 [Catenulispora sp. NF23]|uniref:hypothetical protein n=1 Tax=Catenulispora pinistramenti TaxID=2705254 RepID=UPI001BA9516A|nr:hypothetical protein [Catenulispora pinistramenti]MBS2531383.1 hypothetical protein [Catenulispora pinistramenti]